MCMEAPAIASGRLLCAIRRRRPTLSKSQPGDLGTEILRPVHHPSLVELVSRTPLHHVVCCTLPATGLLIRVVAVIISIQRMDALQDTRSQAMIAITT